MYPFYNSQFVKFEHERRIAGLDRVRSLPREARERGGDRTLVNRGRPLGIGALGTRF